MAKINVLSFEVANLIAAGEVVDRPSSVLKELLENSLDAGADKITVEIRRGGISLMRVTDNGCGISPDDLPLAIKRHATSKIKDREDLDAIETLGFRGEALAATAAVSKLSIITKTRDTESGTMLSSEGGVITEVFEVGCADGTSVTVEDLFYNVPARRKFLKKDATEAISCQAVVSKIAMSRPEVAITFISDGSVKFSTTGDGRLISTLYAIEGAQFSRKLIEIAGESNQVMVSGYVGRSDNVRANRAGQNTFINGRYVKSATVCAALEQAFSSYIAPSKFPVSAIFISINPSLVDVNVHPSKLEVKFSDERIIFDAVYYAVKTALDRAEYRPEAQIGNVRAQTRSFLPIEDDKHEQVRLTGTNMGIGSATQARRDDIVSNRAENGEPTRTQAPIKHEGAMDRDIPADTRGVPMMGTFSSDAYRRDGRSPYSAMLDAEAHSAQPLHKTMAEPSRASASCDAAVDGKAVSDFKAPGALKQAEPCTKHENKPCDFTPEVAVKSADEGAACVQIPDYRYIGEMFNCYLLVEIDKRVLIIDKHAAHERINFERMKQTVKSDGRVASQALLVPITVQADEMTLSFLDDNRAEVEVVGFDFSVSGTRLTLSSIPEGISPDEAADLIMQIATAFSEGTGNAALANDIRLEKALYQVSCKASIKGGRVYGEEHIRWLIEKTLSLPDITVCPHGRPVAMEIKRSQLDREFKRES